MNDLELVKAIAKIEGLEFENGRVNLSQVYFGKKDELWIDVLSDHYLAKALVLDLMYKHDVSICRYQDFVYIESDYTDRPHKASISFAGKEELPRAILTAIAEANTQ